MKLTYLGHSSFLIEGDKIKALIDPFLSNSPLNRIDIDTFNDITHIFVTHGHGDHIGDTIRIAKKNNAVVICNHELGFYFSKQGLNVHTMHIGGRYHFNFGKVKMVNAVHGSSIIEGDKIIEGGNPCGFLIENNGKKIYHAGDTGLMMDMKLLEKENIDAALLPIGGNFTMDIDDALIAIEFIKPKITIPMHYNTFKVIETDVNEFQRKAKDTKVIILKYNESIEV